MSAVQIVIEKLTKNVTEAHISEIFSAYGDIKVVDMPLNRQCKPFSTATIAGLPTNPIPSQSIPIVASATSSITPPPPPMPQ